MVGASVGTWITAANCAGGVVSALRRRALRGQTPYAAALRGRACAMGGWLAAMKRKAIIRLMSARMASAGRRCPGERTVCIAAAPLPLMMNRFGGSARSSCHGDDDLHAGMDDAHDVVRPSSGKYDVASVALIELQALRGIEQSGCACLRRALHPLAYADDMDAASGRIHEVNRLPGLDCHATLLKRRHPHIYFIAASGRAAPCQRKCQERQ